MGTTMHATWCFYVKNNEHIGLNPERLRAEFMSAAEGILFAEVMTDFSKRLKELDSRRREGIDRNELRPNLKQLPS